MLQKAGGIVAEIVFAPFSPGVSPFLGSGRTVEIGSYGLKADELAPIRKGRLPPA